MYAAHFEKQKKETSNSLLVTCLSLIKKSCSDKEKFSVLLEVTQHVSENSFTADDQSVVLQTLGFEFLSRLLRTGDDSCPISTQQSIALCLLSTLTTDPYVVSQPEIKEALHFVNHVLTSNTLGQDLKEKFIPLCCDCEEIISNMAQCSTGISYLIECGTADLLVDYVTSEHCQNFTAVLNCLSQVMRGRGDCIFSSHPDKFHHLMSLTVDKLGLGSDLREKSECARILTSFLNGISTIEVTAQTDWVIKLVQILKKFITIKMSPEDSDAVLFLVSALVDAAGVEVLNPKVVGDAGLLKAVVARVSVEIYVSLDCIDLSNALERYAVLDKAYKLMCNVIEFLGDFGETLDSDSIIVIYRKLVETGETITDFLCSVSSQEVDLPKNHSVVLISVRTIAAMLSEITEEPTQKLLELLPFFNFLCQNVEYTDDVVTEVKNATQAALENIKVMGLNTNQEISDSQSLTAEPPINHPSNLTSLINKVNEVEPDFSSVENDINESIPLIGDLKIDQNTEIKNRTESNKKSMLVSDHISSCKKNNDVHNVNNNQAETKDESHFTSAKVNLTEDDIKEFCSHRQAVYSQRSRPLPLLSRKVSFSSRPKRKTVKGVEEMQHWKPMPDDVLRFLMPAYGFLIECPEALYAMVKCDVFQTVVNFLERSLTLLLQDQSTSCPESMTIHALGLVEQIYTNSPITAADLQCFQSLFELSLLSVPNLLNLPHPPPLVCLKLLEVCLVAYRLQMRKNKRNSSLQRLKHSQSRLFKAIVEYLSTFYEFRQRKGRSLMMHIQKELRVIWPLAGEVWAGCIAGLCTLVRSVEELQDTLVKSLMLPDFLDFLKECEDFESSSSEEVKKMVESLLSLVESAAEGSNLLCELILQHHGQEIASKFQLQKLQRCMSRAVRKTNGTS
ncbi:uncharacterized protein LOC131951066 [Physella acuta]|uniref:uncharacterized protein LOC131951066 n=1 Tax=Physella acuta TaxID=109671 RepID=UPI0027DC6844|nr:uncharacterized protein LOC131951066 [Physella acuta]